MPPAISLGGSSGTNTVLPFQDERCRGCGLRSPALDLGVCGSAPPDVEGLRPNSGTPLTLAERLMFEPASGLSSADDTDATPGLEAPGLALSRKARLHWA